MRLAVALLVLAGCISPADPLDGVDPTAPLYDEADWTDLGAAPATRTVDLVQETGGVFGPGTLPLELEIEHELVYDIHWRLTATPNMLGLTGVRGHGCDGLSWGGSASPESTTSGTCDAMKQGTVQIEAFFEVPVVSYTLSIWGAVDVNETQPSSASSLP